MIVLNNSSGSADGNPGHGSADAGSMKIRHPLIELSIARLIEFIRDPGALFWVFGFPVLLAVVLGFAFRTPPEGQVIEPGMRYIDFLIPGLIGLNIMGSSMWGIGYAVVDSRRRRLLRRFAVTPMRRSHFLLAFFLSRLVFLITEVGLLLLVGWLVFDVGVRGSLLSVAVLSILGSFSFAGLALLVGSRTESTEVASGWMNAVQIPMWLGSGAFFSYSRFPDIVQPVLRFLPLTALNDSMRFVINKGGSIMDMALETAVMILWGIATFALAMKIFKWQ